MAITYTPNIWTGPHFQEIFSELVYANKTVDKGLVRFVDNIKYEQVFTSLTGDAIVQDYAVTPATPQGNLNFGDAVLIPKKQMVHDRFDMNQMLSTMFSEDMAAGAANVNSPKYISAVTEFLKPRIGIAVEKKFWQAITDQLTAATNNIDRAGAALTAANVLDEIKGVYAAIPGEVLEAGEGIMYLPKSAKQLVLIANNDRQYRDLLSVNGDEVKYLDCAIEFVPVPADTIIAGRSSDFIWGTDLLADMGSIELGKVTNESDLQFYKVVFTMGATICVPTQKVLSKV